MTKHVCGLALWFATGLGAYSGEPDWNLLDKQFRDLPSEARRLTGPLFWLHGDESRERLEMYVGKVAEGGNGCFTAESRPHNDWLGPNWYRDLDICLQAAKKNNLEMWIFDERWWPSQMVGGKVPPQHGTKYLEMRAQTAAASANPCSPRLTSSPCSPGENSTRGPSTAQAWSISRPARRAGRSRGRRRRKGGGS